MTARPLTGRRVVVTRAERQSGGLRELLERQGAEVILLPTIEMLPPQSYDPLDDALRGAKRFSWLVVTSANAVRALRERMDALSLPVDELKHLRGAAVGAATAEALRSLGLIAEVMPERAVGEALAVALAPRVRGQRVLLARAEAARDVVPDALQSAGAYVTVVDAYRNAIPADAPQRARAVFGQDPLPDAAVFTSGSTVTHLLDVLGAAGLVFPQRVPCVSIGPLTSAALREAGLAVAAEAEAASLEALIDACCRVLA